MRAQGMVLGLAAILWAGCDGGGESAAGGAGDAGRGEAGPGHGAWVSLVPAEGMGGWESVAYGGEGEVSWEAGVLKMERGADLTGVRWTGTLPEIPYEIELEARKTLGQDFFAGVTVPANREGDCVTLIVGGWGGDLVGISSIDGLDASENETGRYRDFEMGRWFRIRIEVRDQRLEAWIGEERVVELATEGRKLGLREGAIEESAPLGLSCFQTTAEVRGIRWRNLVD